MHKPSTLSLTHRASAPTLAVLVASTELTPVLQYLPCIKGPKLYAVSRCGLTSAEQSRITLSYRLYFYSYSPGRCWSLLPGHTAGLCPPCVHQHSQVLLTQLFQGSEYIKSLIVLPSLLWDSHPLFLPRTPFQPSLGLSVPAVRQQQCWFPALSLSLSSFAPGWNPWLGPGSSSSLAVSGAVNEPCYQPHGTVSRGRGHSQHWVTLSSSSWALG